MSVSRLYFEVDLHSLLDHVKDLVDRGRTAEAHALLDGLEFHSVMNAQPEVGYTIEKYLRRVSRSLRGYEDTRDRRFADLTQRHCSLLKRRTPKNTIVVFRRARTDADSPQRLELVVDVPEGMTDEEAAAFVASQAWLADRMHRALGGHGLEVDTIDSCAPICQPEVTR